MPQRFHGFTGDSRLASVTCVRRSSRPRGGHHHQKDALVSRGIVGAVNDHDVEVAGGVARWTADDPIQPTAVAPGMPGSVCGLTESTSTREQHHGDYPDRSTPRLASRIRAVLHDLDLISPTADNDSPTSSHWPTQRWPRRRANGFDGGTQIWNSPVIWSSSVARAIFGCVGKIGGRGPGGSSGQIGGIGGAGGGGNVGRARGGPGAGRQRSAGRSSPTCEGSPRTAILPYLLPTDRPDPELRHATGKDHARPEFSKPRRWTRR